jgi:hypothetical protein
VETSRLELIGESPHNGRALLATANDEERSALDEAQEFLEAELDDGARHPAGDVLKAARRIGISEPTLRRARRRLGVETEKTGFGPDGAWEWWLPAKASSETPKPAFLHKEVSVRETTHSVTPSELTPSNGELAEALCIICELHSVDGGPCSLRCGECRETAAA